MKRNTSKLDNCAACNKFREVWKYYQEWLCDDCISLISKIAINNRHILTTEQLQIELRKRFKYN